MPLQGGGIDGNEAFQLVRELLGVSLPHISAHGLADEDGGLKAFPHKDFIQPPGLIHERKGQFKGPGRRVSRRVPHQQGIFPFKIRRLPVEQPMIRREAGQENQLRRFALRFCADPTMDGPEGGLINLFHHCRNTSQCKGFYENRRKAFGKYAGNLAGIFGVQIIGEGRRIAGVIGEHIPVAGDHQAGAQLAR